ncbi:HD domain-containing protein [Cognatishimia activa]|uniref:HD domain-containing protein n=1 Tax=Cognatishimia activa TaxID=1715691 RepID=UPI00222F55A2|nr:HD domain-containing protein [Cognatishimia activa]UZD92144.1 HD domain-containing protein [Cognatishimia activa]
MTDRIAQQVAFLTEIDKLKAVDRMNPLLDGSRPENSAEHSWHLALYALVFWDFAHEDADLSAAIRMLLLHDIVEIDAGDHPIHLVSDWSVVAEKEAQAAERIFGFLPADQAQALRNDRLEFEAGISPAAYFANMLDRCQPIFQTIFNEKLEQLPPVDHLDVVKANLSTGRATHLKDGFPDAYAEASKQLGWQEDGGSEIFLQRLAFVNEVDRLKSVLRATTLCDGSRRENSGEHSWHIAMYAIILAEHADRPINIDRVIQMLLIHDLVEIDAGDKPIHGDHDVAEIEAIEQAAADRIFGLLPVDQGQKLRALWDEFEAAESDDAVFAKSVDRVQPVIANLETGGGSWIEYNVSRQQLEDRVGWKVAKGAPSLWEHLQARIREWFLENQLL